MVMVAAALILVSEDDEVADDEELEARREFGAGVYVALIGTAAGNVDGAGV